MYVNLHRLLSSSIWNLPCLIADGWLDRPIEDPVLVRAMGCGVVLLALFLIRQLLSRWDTMVRRELNLLLHQETKYLIVFINVKDVCLHIGFDPWI